MGGLLVKREGGQGRSERKEELWDGKGGDGNSPKSM